MSGIGSVFAVVFGIGWTVGAYAMTRNSPFPVVGVIFPLFGVAFVCMGIAGAIYNFSNASRKKRFSTFDITSDREEPDPLNERFGYMPEEDDDKSTESRLAELDQLKLKGIVSEREYQEQRRRILNSL